MKPPMNENSSGFSRYSFQELAVKRMGEKNSPESGEMNVDFDLGSDLMESEEIFRENTSWKIFPRKKQLKLAEGK